MSNIAVTGQRLSLDLMMQLYQDLKHKVLRSLLASRRKRLLVYGPEDDEF